MIVAPSKEEVTSILLDLFVNSKEGGSWVRSDNWPTVVSESSFPSFTSSSSSYCSWFGITCDANDNVIAVNLGDNNVRGELSSRFWGLTTLELVNFGGEYKNPNHAK